MTRYDEHPESHPQASPEDAALAALRAANPVPHAEELSAADMQRKEATLAAIFAGEDIQGEAKADVVDFAAARAAHPGTRASKPATQGRSWRGRWAGAAAAAVVLIAGAIAVPMLLPDSVTPRADASEILQRAGDAAGQRPSLIDVNVRGKNYQHRIDEDATGRISTTVQIDAAHVATTETTITKESGRELSTTLKEQATQFNNWNGKVLHDVADLNGGTGGVEQEGQGAEGGHTAREIVQKLTLPGVDGEIRQQLFDRLAGLEGNEVAVTPAVSAHSNDEVVTIERPGDRLSVSLLPSTGEVIAADGLVGEGVRTTIDAVGMLGCVSVIGHDGPSKVSLACADQNNVLRDLRWDNWNAPEATATGTAWLNDCDPSCAEDGVKPYPVKVTVSRQRDCGYNLNVYTQLEVTYLEAKPKYEQRTEKHEIGCVNEGN